jgi:hypothetical protein
MDREAAEDAQAEKLASVGALSDLLNQRLRLAA